MALIFHSNPSSDNNKGTDYSDDNNKPKKIKNLMLIKVLGCDYGHEVHVCWSWQNMSCKWTLCTSRVQIDVESLKRETKKREVWKARFFYSYKWIPGTVCAAVPYPKQSSSLGLYTRTSSEQIYNACEPVFFPLPVFFFYFVNKLVHSPL